MRTISINKEISQMASKFIKEFTSSQFTLDFFPPDFKMNNHDVETLKKIEDSCFAPGMSDADKMPGYIEDNNGFAFRDKDTIIAAVMFKEQDNHRKPGEKMLFIEDLLVNLEYQQRGLGKKLLTIVFALADTFSIDIALESPPRNQKYYSQFGFNVIRGESSGAWLARENEHKFFPIKKLSMWRQCQFTPRLSPSSNEQKSKLSATQNSPTVAQMEVIKKLASFALSNTSFWYSHFGHSAEKERALGAIKQELDIHTSAIQQKRKLTINGLAAITWAILSNSLVVRGSGDNLSTTSSIAIFEVLAGRTLSGTKTSSNILENEIETIKDLLTARTAIDRKAYSSYSIFRKTFSNPGEKHAEKSPYCYYEF